MSSLECFFITSFFIIYRHPRVFFYYVILGLDPRIHSLLFFWILGTRPRMTKHFTPTSSLAFFYYVILYYLSSSSGLTRGSIHSFIIFWILGTRPRMTLERCFAWILGARPRMTGKNTFPKYLIDRFYVQIEPNNLDISVEFVHRHKLRFCHFY